MIFPELISLKKFDKEVLSGQFDNIEWIEESGISEKELFLKYEDIMENQKNLPRAILKAETLKLIL